MSTEDAPAPTFQEERIEIVLTVAQQRAICEAEKGEPCFRMWMSKQELARVEADWTTYELSDGRIAVWRVRSELDAIISTDTQLWRAICERILDDGVI